MSDMPAGKTAEEYMAEAAQSSGDPAPKSGGRAGTRSGSRSRSRAGSSAPTGLFTDTTKGIPDSEDIPKVRTAKFKRLHEGVLGLYTGAQMMAALFDPHAAMVIGATKGGAVDAWIDLAEKDTKVADLLTKVTTGSGYGAVIAAHLPMLFPILAKRNIIPGGALFDAALFDKYADEPEPTFAEAAGNDDIMFTDGVVTADGAGIRN